MKFGRIICVISALLFSGTLLWAIPQKISYQGRLMQDGVPSTGTASIEFRFYDSETGGSQIAGWDQNSTVNLSSAGIFSIVLGDENGSDNPIPLEVFMSTICWLNIRMTSPEDVTFDRQEVYATGYSFNANMLDGRNYDAFVSTWNENQVIAGVKEFKDRLNVSSITATGFINASSITVTGNITSSGIFIGNGSGLTGITVVNADALDGYDSSYFLSQSSASDTYVYKSGDTMQGDLGMGASSILNVTSVLFCGQGEGKILYDSGNSEFSIGTANETNLIFKTNDVERIQIDGVDGVVQINNTLNISGSGETSTFDTIIDMLTNSISNVEKVTFMGDDLGIRRDSVESHIEIFNNVSDNFNVELMGTDVLEMSWYNAQFHTPLQADSGLITSSITFGIGSSPYIESYNQSIRISTSIYIIGIASATYFYGDGSNLTGISADDTVSGGELDALLFDSNGLLRKTDADNFDTITDNSANWDTAFTHSGLTSNVHGLTYTAEGSGGGLDADMLDGRHYDAFISTRNENQNIAGTKTFIGMLNVSSVTTTGQIDMGAKRIINLSDPSGTQDAATKNYVDTSVNDANILDSTNTFTGKNYFMGNVGIGTISPDKELDINGSGRKELRVKSTDELAYLIVDGANNLDASVDLYENGTRKWHIYNDGDDSDKIKLFNSGSSGITIDQSGNVGIGLTSPGHKLHLKASIDPQIVLRVDGNTGSKVGEISLYAGYGYMRLYDSGGANTVHLAGGSGGGATGESFFMGHLAVGLNNPAVNDKLTVKSAGTSSSYYGLKVQDSSGNNQLVVRSDGKVGIGTASPSTKLHIVTDSGSTYRYLTLERPSARTWAISGENWSGNSDFGVRDITAGTIPFFIQGDTGKIGFGTTSPNYKLHCSSAAYFAKEVRADDFIEFSNPIPETALDAVLHMKNDENGKLDHKSFPSYHKIQVCVKDAEHNDEGEMISEPQYEEKECVSLSVQTKYLIKAFQEYYYQTERKITDLEKEITELKK